MFFYFVLCQEMPLYYTDGSDKYQKIKLPRSNNELKMYVSILVNSETRIVIAEEDNLANSRYYELIIDQKNNDSKYLEPELWSHNGNKAKLIETSLDKVNVI